MKKREETTSIESTLAVVVSKLGYIEQDIAEIKNTLKKEYVTVQEFEPVKKSVYGVIAAILTGVFGFIGYIIVEVFSKK